MSDFVGSVFDSIREIFSRCPWLLFLFCLGLFFSCVSFLVRVLLSPFDEIDIPGFFSFLWRKIKAFAISILLRLGIIYQIEEVSEEVPSDEM